MGENEAIKGLMFFKEKLYNGIFQDRLNCIDYAITVIKEIQQYREIGSVGEIKQAIGVLSLSENDIIKTFHELNEYHKIGTVEQVKNQKENLNVAYQIISEYESIGTVEECREAIELQKPKKPISINHKEYADKIVNAEFLEDAYLCPNCKTVIRSGSHCGRCGQKLNLEFSGRYQYENLEGMEDE